MPDRYLTLKNTAEGLYKEKGSKFIAYASPVGSEDHIRSELERIKKLHHDARHHCYAWRLHDNPPRTRANDDGEPAYSAGKPILGQIESFNLHNSLVVVVRYFGGTLLGMGGLIHAYRTAAKEALTRAELQTIYLKSQFEISCEYSRFDLVMRLINGFTILNLEQEFQEKCHIRLDIRLSEKERLPGLFDPYPDISITHIRDE